MSFEQTKEPFELAKRLLAKYPIRRVSERTRSRYMQTGAHFFHNPDDVEKTTSKATFYLRKAAVTFYSIEQIKVAIDALDVQLLTTAARILARFDTPLKGEAAISAGRKCPLATTRPRCSKRRSLKGLPADWRELMLKGVTGAEREILLVLSAGGLRPEEISKGVLVTPHENGILLKVHGAKVTESSGQPLRTFFVSNQFAAELAQGGERVIKAQKANTLSQWVRRHAKKVFGTRRYPVSAYSFRHQFSADVKASGSSDSDTSALMGHCASDTKKHYGTRNQSCSNLAVRLISASREVRHKQNWAPSSTKSYPACGF